MPCKLPSLSTLQYLSFAPRTIHNSAVPALVYHPHMQNGSSISGNIIVAIAAPAISSSRCLSTRLRLKNIALGSTAQRPLTPFIVWLMRKCWQRQSDDANGNLSGAADCGSRTERPR